MRIGILGPLLVETDAAPVPITGARIRALLIRLALDPGRTVTVEALASALWPGRGPTQPANAVQTSVSRLRRALPGTDVVRSVPGGYRLDLAPEAVDAVRFERLAAEGRQALVGGDEQTAVDRLRDALALWRGDALAEVADVPYAAAAATRLAELRLAATEDRIAAELGLPGRIPPGTLVAELRQLTSAYPLRERVRSLLVRTLHAAGRPAEALAAYEEVRRLLADELGTDPGPELREAHLAVLRGAPVPTPPTAQPQPTQRARGNLRAELTSFVGRGEERRRTQEQLASGRLVTLVGPGGAGKTRLATAVAADLAGSVSGGVWLVELAPVSDPAEVPAAVVDALGLREVGLPDLPAAPGTSLDPTVGLVEALSATETVLVLDNCEHLLDATARLASELLSRCPRLRIIATSREPLGVGGEALSPVPPLDLPAPDTPAEQAAAFPAVQLFADRAAAVRPGFVVTDATVTRVVEICHRLDGLPLAIELAAARLRSLTLDQVVVRLDDRFRLLTGGSRTTLPRHQTLRAVVAWSWDLLTSDERRVAERLTVFPDLILPGAAARVCGATMDTLAALVDKSLLRLLDSGGAAGPRYRMLETIRQYGWERLAVAGELDSTRAAHCAYYLELAERAAPHLRGAGQVPWIARLQADGGNLGTAFGFAHDTGDTDTLVRLAAALSHFWTVQGDHVTAARRLRIAVDTPGEAPSTARAVVAAAYLLNVLLAGGDAGDAVEVARRHHDPAATDPATAMTEAMLALARNDTAAGLRATARVLPDADPWTRGMLWLLRSWLHGNDAATVELHEALDAAAEAFRDAGERWGLAVTLTHRAHVQTTFGDLDGAVAGLTEALAQQRALGESDGAVLPRALLAAARARQGDRDRARADLLQLMAGDVRARNLVLARLSLGDLARWDGDLVDAARQYEEAGQELARIPFDASLFRAMLRCAQGRLAIAGGQLEAAAAHLADALERAVGAPDIPIAADVAVAVAELRSRAGAGNGEPHRPPAGGQGGSAATAAEVLGAADALRGSPDASHPDVVALSSELRAELGERAYRAAYGRGVGLDRPDALALIRAQIASR